MIYTDLEAQKEIFRPVLFLESIFPHGLRQWGKAFFLLCMLCSAGAVFILDTYLQYAGGIFFISFGMWLLIASLDAFYFSWYFRGIDGESMTYELATLIHHTSRDDVTISLFTSSIGYHIARRAGLTEEDIHSFIDSRQTPLTGFAAVYEDDTSTVSSYVRQTLAQDKELQSFLFSLGREGGDLIAASQWIERMHAHEKRSIRWWSREHLSSFEGIGVAWSYGKAYLLSRYSRPLVVNHPTLTSAGYFGTYVSAIEAALSRGRNANALLVGDPGVGKEDVIIGLQKRITSGRSDSQLQRYWVTMFDTHMFSSDVSSKQECEGRLSAVLEQAAHAGNIILVLPLAELFQIGEEYNTDVIGLISPYFMSDELHIIAIADTDAYHTHIEQNGNVARYLDRIYMEEGNEDIRMRILEDDALFIESSQRVFISYPTIKEVSRGVERFFSGASGVDKGANVLAEAASEVHSRGEKDVHPKDIQTVIERLTGVPIGEIEDTERQKLLHLEEEIHKRVVGQNEAIHAISDALRRSRSGLTDPGRPMGSFLFLGPTGVGKTETAKALAETFFGNNDYVVRLDMSEYTGPNALSRLIGSRRDGTPGILASHVRDNPYGVLHLDEFEKTDTEVTNLFLQIIDEGYFTDANGKEVNVRNMIIVATSNAGSDLIYDYIKQGGTTGEHKKEILNTIIKRRTFSPELLNRFDGVILFHPLTDEHLERITSLLLDDLNERMREKGYTVEVTPELVEFLVEKGRNPQFGARPLRRAIQDHVESALAQKLVEGGIQKGQSITVRPEDLKDQNGYTSADSDDTSFSFSDEE